MSKSNAGDGRKEQLAEQSIEKKLSQQSQILQNEPKLVKVSSKTSAASIVKTSLSKSNASD